MDITLLKYKLVNLFNKNVFLIWPLFSTIPDNNTFFIFVIDQNILGAIHLHEFNSFKQDFEF